MARSGMSFLPQRFLSVTPRRSASAALADPSVMDLPFLATRPATRSNVFDATTTVVLVAVELPPTLLSFDRNEVLRPPLRTTLPQTLVHRRSLKRLMLLRQVRLVPLFLQSHLFRLSIFQRRLGPIPVLILAALLLSPPSMCLVLLSPRRRAMPRSYSQFVAFAARLPLPLPILPLGSRILSTRPGLPWMTSRIRSGMRVVIKCFCKIYRIIAVYQKKLKKNESELTQRKNKI